MGPGEQQVVLTLPAGPRFGEAARVAVGEMARQRSLGALEWGRLLAAVDRTLAVLQRDPDDRVRLTLGGPAHAVSVQAELTGDTGRSPAEDGDGGAAGGGNRGGGNGGGRTGGIGPAVDCALAARLRDELDALVEGAEVDAERARVRFHARRH